MSLLLIGAKVPRNFRSREQKLQDIFSPGSESSTTFFLLLGAKVS